MPLLALIAAANLGGPTAPAVFALTPNDAWAASPDASGGTTGPALAGGSGTVAPAEDTASKDAASPFVRKVIGNIDRPSGDWYEQTTNYVGVKAGLGSRKWIKQVVFWLEGNTVTVGKPSMNPETGVFGWWTPVGSHPNRNGSAWGAAYMQPYEGYERRIVFKLELNSVPTAPGYCDRRVDRGDGTPGAYARFVDPVIGLDTNTGLAGSPWKTLYKAHAAAPDGGCLYVEPGTSCVEDRMIYAGNLPAGITKAQANTRRIDTRCRVAGQGWTLTRSFRAFTLAAALVSTDASGAFTVNAAGLANPGSAGIGLYLGWPILDPSTGQKHYIASISAYSGTPSAAFTGTLDKPFSLPLTNAPFSIGYASSGAAAHILSALNLGMFDCTVDQARMPAPLPLQSATSPANTRLAPAATGAAPGSYTIGGRIWWQNCKIIDPYGTVGPMKNYQSPGYPAPPASGEFADGTGYWDSGTAGPEALPAYISFISRTVSTTSPVNDPYNQTVGFSGFGECLLATRAIAGDVLRRNCRGTICHDLNYFNQNNVTQVGNAILQADTCYYRQHREPVLTVLGTPAFDGTYTTITLAGTVSFKQGITAAFIAQQGFCDAHFLSGALAPGQLAWNSYRSGTDAVTGGHADVRTGDVRLYQLNGGVAVGTTVGTRLSAASTAGVATITLPMYVGVGTSLTISGDSQARTVTAVTAASAAGPYTLTLDSAPASSFAASTLVTVGASAAGTSQVVVWGDCTAAKDGDTFAVFVAQHPDIAQFGSPPGSSSSATDQGAPGQNNYVFQHNRYAGYDVQWVFAAGQQLLQNGGYFIKALPVPGGCTLSADGSATVTFSSAISLNVGDMLVVAPNSAANIGTGTLTSAVPVGASAITMSFAPVLGAIVSFGGYNRYVAAVSGSGPYTVTLDAAIGNGVAIASGTAVTSTIVAAVLATSTNGLSATLSQAIPALSGASFTREIGMSTAGAAATFSSSVTGLLASDDSVIVKSGQQVFAYSRVLSLSPDGLSATLAQPIVAPLTLTQADQGWVRFIQGKSTKDVLWMGNILEDLWDISGLQAAYKQPPLVTTPVLTDPPAGQFQQSACHWVYAQNTICTHSPKSSLVLRIAVSCAADGIYLFDNILPSIAGDAVNYYGHKLVQSPPYQGVVSDNNHWLANLAGGGSVLTSTTMGVPPVEPGAAIGPVTFDDTGPVSGTYRPKLGGGLTRAPKGNTATGGLLLPAAINPVTGVVTALPGPASTYLVGAQPAGVA